MFDSDGVLGSDAFQEAHLEFLPALDLSLIHILLGRLHEGGTFDVRQEEVAPGHWEVTLIDVHITGKALFFRTISEKQHEVRNEFQQVPGSLTLAQAVEVLKAKDCR